MKGKFLKLGIISMVLVLSLVGIVGCGDQNVANNNTQGTDVQPSEGTPQEEVYIVGTDAAYPPFEKQVGGELVGFDMDIIRAVAEAADIKIEIKHTGWDPLFNGLDNKTVDMGISCVTITEKRQESYDFSDPYFEATQLIMVPVDSKVASLADLEGLKIGVQSATTGDLALQDAFGKTYEGIKGYDDMPSSIDDLLIGRVDAVVGDNAVLQEYLKTVGSEKFKLIKDSSFEKEYYGIIFPKIESEDKENNELENDYVNEFRDKINEAIKTIKENGKYDEIYNAYFAG